MPTRRNALTGFLGGLATVPSQGELAALLYAARLKAQRALVPAGSTALGLPDAVAWAERVSGGALDPWQREVMASSDPALLLLCPRQTGKSHVVSLRAAYRAKYLRRRVGVLSPTLRQSGVIYRRVQKWLRVDGQSRFVRQTAIELELDNGGGVAAFPGDRPDLAIRGDTLDDLYVDEASRIKDALIAAATPTTATRRDANITYLSTPAGQRGEFYRAWFQQSWWTKIQVDVAQCARISADFLAREKQRLGPLYDQEYGCKFLAAPGGIFDPEMLDQMFTAPAPEAAVDHWLPKAGGMEAQLW